MDHIGQNECPILNCAGVNLHWMPKKCFCGCKVVSGGSDNELALVSKQQKRFVDLNVGDLLSELLGIYSRDLKKSFKNNRPLVGNHFHL